MLKRVKWSDVMTESDVINHRLDTVEEDIKILYKKINRSSEFFYGGYKGFIKGRGKNHIKQFWFFQT